MGGTLQATTPPRGRAWDTWLHHPQKSRLRRALLQVHLWSGIALSLYVLLMSISGTILIYRVDISKASLRPRTVTGVTGPRLGVDALKQAAERAYPGYQAVEVSTPGNPNQAVAVSLSRGAQRLQRLFNPFTGADMGDAVPASFRFIEWLTDLHDELLYEPLGRVVNGIGGMATTLLCATGIVVWWPGTAKWRRALTVSWKGDGKAFNWGLHRAVGIWSVAFILFWGISGVYLAVPEPFETAVAFLDPPAKFSAGSRARPSFGEQALSWLARLHFGRFGGQPTKFIWALFGLAPVALVVTGMCMWWNRVGRPKLAAPAEGSQLRSEETLSVGGNGAETPRQDIVTADSRSAASTALPRAR